VAEERRVEKEKAGFFTFLLGFKVNHLTCWLYMEVGHEAEKL